MDAVKGYSLFNDVDNIVLQQKNRTQVMVNIFEEHLNLQGGQVKISAAGMALLLSYFTAIPENERLAVYTRFQDEIARTYSNVQ